MDTLPNEEILSTINFFGALTTGEYYCDNKAMRFGLPGEHQATEFTRPTTLSGEPI